jgi:hypothetical protein
MPRSEAWDQLRLTRSRPPGDAAEGDGASLYRAAMQQSEDLALAAESTGRAARPLPLFYALSQAGQVIEACCGVDGGKNHGLSLEEGTGPVLERKLRIRATANGRYQSVSDCVRSARPKSNAAVTLADIIASLPEIAGFLPPDPVRRTPLELRQDFIGADGSSWVIRVLGRDSQPAWDDAFLVTPHEIDGEEALHALADDYPSAGVLAPDGPVVETNPTNDGRWATSVQVDIGDGGIGAIAPEYRGSRWLRPHIPPLGEPPVPLMSWWLLAFALSMLARYHPVDWVKALDVDSSPDAVLLDRAMMEALRVLPELVLEAVTNVPR